MQTAAKLSPEIEIAAAKPRDPSLYELARQELSEADNDVRVASDRLVESITSNENLLRATIRQVVEEAARTVTGSVMRSERFAIFHAATRSPQAGRAAVAALAGGIATSLLDFPLANGIRLRDATREQVEAQAGLYSASAADANRKAAWLRAVASKMGGAAKVADALKEEDVVALLNSVPA